MSGVKRRKNQFREALDAKREALASAAKQPKQEPEPEWEPETPELRADLEDKGLYLLKADPLDRIAGGGVQRGAVDDAGRISRVMHVIDRLDFGKFPQESFVHHIVGGVHELGNANCHSVLR